VATTLHCALSEATSKVSKELDYDISWRATKAANKKFLHRKGFSDEHVIRLPGLLFVKPESLEAAWKDVKGHQRYSVWRKDPWILINCLLYFAEKREKMQSYVDE
jgi:hypothetical protein